MFATDVMRTVAYNLLPDGPRFKREFLMAPVNQFAIRFALNAARPGGASHQ
jgi:hypothetical protein